MKVFRHPRVFISYSHNDRRLLDDLVALLKEQSVEPMFDERIRVGDRLDQTVRNLIETSDGVIVLGSDKSLQSVWCEREVQHARRANIPVYPVLVDNILPERLPAWFTGKNDLANLEVLYAVCLRSQGWRPLGPVIQELRRLKPLKPRWMVTIILTLLLVAPIPIMLLFGSVVGKAAASVRSQQALIEQMNRDIEESVKAESTMRAGPMISRKNSPGRREWIDPKSGRIVAWDMIDGENVRARHFLDTGGEIAIDTIIAVRAPNGTESLRKTRHIQSRGTVDTVIEEEFDGAGLLISKRVRPGRDARWYSYGDVATSYYPAGVPAYPIIGYR